MRIHRTTDVDGYFADPSTRTLLTALFGDQPTDDSREAGLCAEVDPDMWFPEKGGTTHEAKRICGRCPIRAECLEGALARGERFGVWGGLSERERRRLTRVAV